MRTIDASEEQAINLHLRALRKLGREDATIEEVAMALKLSREIVAAVAAPRIVKNRRRIIHIAVPRETAIVNLSNRKA